MGAGSSSSISQSSVDLPQLLCCACVEQSTVAMEETCGRYDMVLDPGCHFMPWCVGRRVAGYLSLRVQQLDVRCETKSKDNVFVTVVASVQYRALADRAYDAFYRLSNAREQIQSYVFDVIRASVPNMNLDQVFEQKDEVARAVEEELAKAMDTYGYEIVQTLIVDIEPDEVVKRAMNDINAAARGGGGARRGREDPAGVARRGGGRVQVPGGRRRRAAAAGHRRRAPPLRARREGRHGHGPRHAVLRHHQGHRRHVARRHRLHPARARRRARRRRAGARRRAPGCHARAPRRRRRSQVIVHQLAPPRLPVHSWFLYDMHVSEM